MKILIVSQWFVFRDFKGEIVASGGTERYAYGVAKQLQENGNEVIVLFGTRDKEFAGWGELGGVKVYGFKVPEEYYGYFVDFLSLVNTLKMIKWFNPDIVHIISARYRFAVGAIVASNLKRKKLLFTRTTMPHRGRKYYSTFFDNLIFKKVAKKVDAVISFSNEMKEVLLQDINPKRIAVIPTFTLGFSNYKKSEKIKNSVLFVGRLELESKGIDLLLESLHLIKKEIPGVKLYLCGSGDKKTIEYLLELIYKNELEENVFLYGYLSDDELADMYSKTEVLAMPSPTEGMPMVLLEAMDSGLPVIGFDIGPLKEALDNGKYGILVKKGNIKELANQVIYLLNNNKKRKYYSLMSLKRSREYSKAKVIGDIEKMYEKIIKEE